MGEINQLTRPGLVEYECDQGVHEGQYVIISSTQRILTICEAKVLICEKENNKCQGPPRYHRVERGANCEAEGYARITSLAECISATKELGHGIRNIPATLDIPNWEYAPRGCYYRPWNLYQPEATDGDLWFNENDHNRAPCSVPSNCICKTESRFPTDVHIG